MGIESLATSLGEERGTLEEVIEPPTAGLFASNAPGSDLTPAGYKVVGWLAGLTTYSKRLDGF